MNNKLSLSLLLLMLSISVFGQQKVGDKWVDNNLSFKITEDKVKLKGEFTFCVLDTSRETCIENLSTGIEVKVFSADDKQIWEGIASGRTKSLKLPKALPKARYMTLKAFKPWVTNKLTGNLIHQSAPIEIKYYIK